MIRAAVSLCLVLACSLGFARPAAAQDPSTAAADRGLQIAQSRCSACHAVEAGGTSPNRRAPPFTVVATRYGQRSLERKLAEIQETGHYDMPALVVHSDEAADLASYFERLNLPKGR
jgi:mono/diheme cytochrome c family protein